MTVTGTDSATTPATAARTWLADFAASLGRQDIAGAVAVARGRGHLRLRDAKAWTLLITMVELKGFEEKKNERRIKGAEHGVARGARAGSSAARRSRHASAMKTNPMSSSSAEGKAASC